MYFCGFFLLVRIEQNNAATWCGFHARASWRFLGGRNYGLGVSNGTWCRDVGTGWLMSNCRLDCHHDIEGFAMLMKFISRSHLLLVDTLQGHPLHKKRDKWQSPKACFFTSIVCCASVCMEWRSLGLLLTRISLMNALIRERSRKKVIHFFIHCIYVDNVSY